MGTSIKTCSVTGGGERVGQRIEKKVEIYGCHPKTGEKKKPRRELEDP